MNGELSRLEGLQPARALALSRLGLRLLEVDDLGLMARLLETSLSELGLQACFARYSADGRLLQRVSYGSPFGGLQRLAGPTAAPAPAVSALELTRREPLARDSATLVAAEDARHENVRWLVTSLGGAPSPGDQAAIVAPLIAGRRRTGWLIVLGSLTEQDLSIVSALAGQAAAAARNADLIERLKQALQRERSTAELLERLELLVAQISSEADLSAVLPRLTRAAAESLDAAAVLVYLLDDQRERLELVTWHGVSDEGAAGLRQLGLSGAEDALRQALESGGRTSVGDLAASTIWSPFGSAPLNGPAQTLLALPLQAEADEPLGMLLVLGDRQLAARLETGELAVRYARHIAVAIGAGRQQERRTLAARSEAVGELARSIPHELGQPLAIISGYAELISEGLLSGEQLREACQEIVRGCSELAQLTQRLGRLSRYETIEFGSDRRLIDWQLAAPDA